MNFTNYIAKKYLLSKRQFRFITIISWLSFIGITFGVAILIVVLSIFNGFQNLTKNQFIGFDPHIQILEQSNNFFKIDSNLIKQIKEIDGVASVNLDVSFESIIISDNKIKQIEVKTNDDLIKKGFIYNNINKKNNQDGLPNITIGIQLANIMNLKYGDTVELIQMDNLDQIIEGRSWNLSNVFIVNEIFNSNVKNYDEVIAFIDYQDALNVLNPEINSINFINIRLENIDNLNKIKKNISKLIPSNLKLRTWEEINPVLFAVMRLEKLSTFSILSIIIILAIFNILTSMTMTVVEKQKDIGILRSLGSKSKQIYLIFFKMGSYLGIIGTISGAILGLAIVYLQINYKIFSLDKTRYILDAIPMEINISECILIIIFSLLLTSVASYFPARKASKTKIYQSLRTE